MRAHFKHNIRSYSGKLGNVVFYNYFNHQLCLVRKFGVSKATEAKENMKSIFLHINDLYWASAEAYREDLSSYAKRNAMENMARNPSLRQRMPNSKMLFSQCMWKWAKENPETVDLKTVTLDDMRSVDSPVCRVCTCVTAGYLKKVTGWEHMDKSI